VAFNLIAEEVRRRVIEKSTQLSFGTAVDTKKVVSAKLKGFAPAQLTSKATTVEAVPFPLSNEVVEVKEVLL